MEFYINFLFLIYSNAYSETMTECMPIPDCTNEADFHCRKQVISSQSAPLWLFQPQELPPQDLFQGCFCGERKTGPTPLSLFHRRDASAEPVLPLCLLTTSPHFNRFEGWTLQRETGDNLHEEKRNSWRPQHLWAPSTNHWWMSFLAKCGRYFQS